MNNKSINEKQDLASYKKIWFIGIIIIALGIVISTTMSRQLGSLGIVFIAIGGFLFIVSLKKKNDMNQGDLHLFSYSVATFVALLLDEYDGDGWGG